MDQFKTAPPLSMQIAERLKEKIKNKELRPGERIQSVRKLASELSVGRQVIVSAFDILARENIIKKMHGCGVFINPSIAEPAKPLRIGCWINAVSAFSASNSGVLFNICRRAAETEHNVVLGTSQDCKDIKIWAAAHNIDGIIVTGIVNDGLVKIIRALKKPFVVLGNYELNEKVISVEIDMSVLETAVMNEIDKHSCKSVAAILGKKSYLISRELADHVTNGIAAAGKIPIKELLCFSENEDGYSEMKKLFGKSKNRPDLIYVTEQAFPGVARFYFENKLSGKNAPRLIVSCGHKDKIPYPEMVDIIIECGMGGTEKSFDLLIEMIKGKSRRKTSALKLRAKLLYGKSY